jgi:hypothetical protein
LLAVRCAALPIPPHPRDVVADFIVACVVTHGPVSFCNR